MSLDEREAQTSAQHQGRTHRAGAPHRLVPELRLRLERRSARSPKRVGVGMAVTASGNTETCRAVPGSTHMLTRALGAGSKITYYQKRETQTVGRKVELLSCTFSL